MKSRPWLRLKSTFPLTVLPATILAIVVLSAAKCAEPAQASPTGPAGKQAATDAIGDPLPDGAILRLGTMRFRPPSTVSELALSPNETSVVTIGEELIVWDTTTGKERWRVKSRDFLINLSAGYGVRAIAFCGDGTQFYTTGRPNEAIVWDTQSGHHETLTIESTDYLGSGLFQSIDVTPDAQMIAVGGDGGVLVCDQDRNILYSIVNSPDAPLEVKNDRDRLKLGGHYSLARFSPDTKRLAVVTSDAPELVRLFESDTGRELERIKLTAKLVRLAFSPDSKQLATTERDSAVRLYDIATEREIWSHVVRLNDPHENYTSAIAFNPDTKTIAVCATDYRIYLLDAATGQEQSRLVGHSWYPWGLAFAGDGKTLYSSGWDRSIRHWDLASNEQMALPEGIPASGIVAASPDGQLLAYGDDSDAIHVVDTGTGKELRKLVLPGTHYSQLAFSSDSRLLAGGGPSDDNVHATVWDVSRGSVVHRWVWPKGRDPKSRVDSLSFAPDGTRLAAAVSRQSAASVWDLKTGEKLAQLPHRLINGLSFSPDSETLATAGWDSTVRFWQAGSGELRGELNVKASSKSSGDLRMHAVEYAPEGGLLATAHLDGIVRIWQVDNLSLRKTFQIEGRFSDGAIRFSPDGLWLGTGSMSGQLSLWDPRTGDRVLSVGEHQGSVYSVAFGRDARTLLSGSDDGASYLWNAHPRGALSKKDPPGLWDDLAGKKSTDAYRAMWELAAGGEPSTRVVAEALRKTQSIVDPARTTSGLGVEKSRRVDDLKRRLLDNDPDVADELTVRRGLSLLSETGTPAAIAVLKELADRDPNSDVSRLALAALQRCAPPRNP